MFGYIHAFSVLEDEKDKREGTIYGMQTFYILRVMNWT